MSTVTPRSCMVSSSENASRHLERDGVAEWGVLVVVSVVAVAVFVAVVVVLLLVVVIPLKWLCRVVRPNATGHSSRPPQTKIDHNHAPPARRQDVKDHVVHRRPCALGVPWRHQPLPAPHLPLTLGRRRRRNTSCRRRRHRRCRSFSLTLKGVEDLQG